MDDLEKGHTGALDEPLSGPKASPARVTRNPLSMESHTKTEMRQTSAPRIESIPKKASGNITSASETQALPTSSPDPRTSQGPQYSGPQAKEFTEKTSVEQDYRNILRTEVINQLYRFNIAKARLALYKDYIKIASQGAEKWDGGNGEGQVELQADLKTYSSTMAEYRSFTELQHYWESMHLDESLLQIAVRRAAIEDLESRLETNNNTDVIFLSQVKQKLRYYEASILPGSSDTLNLESITTDRNSEEYRLRVESEKVLATADSTRRARNLQMAYFGSLALIVPMLIMSLHPTLVTTLLTTSLFVFVVSMILAITMSNAEPKDVAGDVAAYTAVLVVFVGTTNSGSSTGSSTPPTSEKHLSSGAIGGIVFGAIGGLTLLVAIAPEFLGLFFGLLAALISGGYEKAATAASAAVATSDGLSTESSRREGGTD